MTSKERHQARFENRVEARRKKRLEKIGIYDSFALPATLSALIRAHWDSRQGVIWKASVERFNYRYLKNIAKLKAALDLGKDVRCGFYVFDIVERGKLRHVHSLHYSERVVRRSYCINALVPILSRSLIYDSGASLKGKGLDFARDRTAAVLRKWVRKHGLTGHILVTDFHDYFGSIVQQILCQVYGKRITDRDLHRLACQFASGAERGLYIGPEDSQIGALTYVSPIDHWIKDVLGVKAYVRYADDAFLIAETKEECEWIRDKLIKRLAEIGITPNPNKTQIIALRKGFTFLKTIYKFTATNKLLKLPWHWSIVKERRKLKSLHGMVARGEIDLSAVITQYMSWRGGYKRRNARKTVHKMDILFYRLFNVKPWAKTRRRKRRKGNFYD